MTREVCPTCGSASPELSGIAGRCDNNAFHRPAKHETLMPCGHPESSVEGHTTKYCGGCAREQSTHCKHGRKWYRCCDQEANVDDEHGPSCIDAQRRQAGLPPLKQPAGEGEAWAELLWNRVVQEHKTPEPGWPDTLEARHIIRVFARKVSADAAAKAVEGMHAQGCRCGQHDDLCYHKKDGDECLMMDPRCLAARKKAADEA